MANRTQFTALQREREWFHGLRVPHGMWAVVRVDGRGFSRLTKARYDKPYDHGFAATMTACATALTTELDGRFGYTYSDEISVVLPPQHALFGRGVEKLVSVSAGLVSAVFTHEAGRPAHFDARLWIGASAEDVVDYMSWRQADAASSSLTNWCYWTLRDAGATAKEATARLSGATVADKNELLFNHGVNYNVTPAWQRRGVALHWEDHAHDAHDPRTGEHVVVTRRRLTADTDLPRSDEFRGFVQAALTGTGTGGA